MTPNKNNSKAKRMMVAGVAATFVLSVLMAVPVMRHIQASPDGVRVRNPVVHGEKIDSPAATTVPIPGVNALAVMSNSIAARNSGVGLRPKLAPADSNSLPQIIVQDGKKYLNVTFAKLSSFTFQAIPVADGDVGDDPRIAAEHTRKEVPASILALGGKPAAVTGFMLPVIMEDGLASDFLLLRNQSACCYGVMPRVNEWVVVHAARGVKPVKDVPITALGAFQVGEIHKNGELLGIYSLECDQLLPTR